jgi:outer membrane receptor protein involved in Fe transport
MKDINERHRSFKLSKLALVIASLVTLPTLAADEIENDSDKVKNQSVVEESIERISVTGSRIRSVNGLAPSQITSISGKDLELTGHINVMDALMDLPSVAGGLTSETAGFSYANTGMNTVNLRNLGHERTLVLVNGRRYVSSDVGEILADMNSIPTSLVERIDITTGGGSATYGSGAIAGVVNFILKNDFEGVEVEARYSKSGQNDNESDLVRLTLGGNFADDKGNVVINFEKSTSEGLASRDRGLTGVRFDRDNNVLNPPVPSSYAPKWRYDIGSQQIAWQDGQVGDWDINKDGYLHANNRTISTPVDRTIFNALSHYYLNDDVRAFAEFTYAKTETSNPLDLYYIGSATSRGEAISVDNPFVPDELRKIALSENVDSINYRGRLNEFGPGGFDSERVVTRYVLGLDGTFADDWDWELSYNYGEVTNDQSGKDIHQLAYKKATDVITDPDTGEIRCRDQAFVDIGCVPTNVFAPFSDEMMGFWFNETTLDGKLEQETMVATISNGALFSLPAGDVGFAAGYEHRSEFSEEHPDSGTKSGMSGGVKIDSLKGQYEVDEFFVELNVPVLRDVSFADFSVVKSLGVNMAWRTSEYSHSGRNDSWQLGTRWEINDELVFRAQYSEAFRAPTIADMFNGNTRQGLGLTSIDPCHNVTLTTAGEGVSQQQADACRAIPAIANAIQNGAAFDGEPKEDNIDRYSYFGASPDLEVETAQTTTLGFIYNPSYLEDLSFIVDYYDITIDNIITGTDNRYKNERCLEGIAAFCRSVERDSQTGVIHTMHNYVFNLAGREVAGFDVETNYKHSLNDYGDLRFKLLYNYVSKHQTQSTPGTPWIDELGELPYFEHKANFTTTYYFEDFTANWSMVYQGDIYDDKDGNYFNNHVDSVLIHNAQIRYSFGENGAYEVYGGVDNVFDQDPPFLPEGYNHGRGESATAGEYSRVGRMLYIGTKLSF